MSLNDDGLGTPERKVSDYEAELIANHMVNKLVERLSDERTVNALVSVWSKQFDQRIGHAFRRGVIVLLTAFTIFVAMRFEDVLHFFRR